MHEGVCGVTDIDTVVANSLGVRWASRGPFWWYHRAFSAAASGAVAAGLGGGAGGGTVAEGEGPGEGGFQGLQAAIRLAEEVYGAAAHE